MQGNTKPKSNSKLAVYLVVISAAFIVGGFLYVKFNQRQAKTPQPEEQVLATAIEPKTEPAVLDTAAYDAKLLEMANVAVANSATASQPNLWPVKAPYPKVGALLPFNRIVAYYGNLYSKNMGVLGEYPEEVMLDKLAAEVKKWQTADPTTPVMPALHYIAVVAQAGAGRDGKYRARMSGKEIEKVLAMAKKIDGQVFLDVQVGLSTVEQEVPLLEEYLKLPNVHLGIDPEFSMKTGAKPGTAIGTLDAQDINYAAQYLSNLVQKYDLPPKMLVIHRFTQKMVTNTQAISPLAEVQIIMDMDGFGGKGVKLNTYNQYIVKEPVQFTGFKLFYKNDTAGGKAMFTPEELLKLSPRPVYVQYQ